MAQKGSQKGSQKVVILDPFFEVPGVVWWTPPCAIRCATVGACLWWPARGGYTVAVGGTVPYPACQHARVTTPRKWRFLKIFSDFCHFWAKSVKNWPISGWSWSNWPKLAKLANPRSLRHQKHGFGQKVSKMSLFSRFSSFSSKSVKIPHFETLRLFGPGPNNWPRGCQIWPFWLIFTKFAEKGVKTLLPCLEPCLGCQKWEKCAEIAEFLHISVSGDRLWHGSSDIFSKFSKFIKFMTFPEVLAKSTLSRP